ncbi:MAG: relaxase domain-containing protein [Verrucomicrobiales bacterium]|nr:relaxase domain-containing protein [Verrucomicrobiales bacterium]
MLSISKAIRGDGAAEYYLHLAARDDYYLQADEPPGRWMGTGARRLGLVGEVAPEAFRTLFQGRHPEHGEALVRNAGSVHRRAAWDFTWSVPKSVSTFWSQVPEWARSRVERAVVEAVEAGVGYLEQVGAVARRGEDGVHRERADLVFAVYLHGCSRALDPQVHAHAVLLNVGVRSDGSTGALDPRELYRHQQAADALFRAELAVQLERRLGLALVREGRSFELAGVDHALRLAFSQRRQEIQRVLAERGWSGARAAEAVAFETRAPKRSPPRAMLLEAWQAIGRAYGWGSTQALSLLEREPPRPRDPEVEGRLTADYALDEVTRHDSHFAARALTRALGDEAQGRGLGAREVLRIRDEVLRSPALLAVGTWKHEARFTTPELWRAEAELLSAAAVLSQAQRPGDPALSPVVSLVLEAHPELRPEQRLAVAAVTAGAGGLHLVNGLAGTGKSYAFRVAREIWDLQGAAVQGACLSGKAASGLQEASGIPSQTVHALLAQWRRGEAALSAHSVLLVDEAAMVGTRALRDLTVACVRSGAKLVLAGDARQLQAIDPGGGFAALERAGEVVSLTEIVRQREPWARQAVRDFAEGRAAVALEAFHARGHVTRHAQLSEVERRLMEEWALTGVADPEGRVILAGTQTEVARLNAAAQGLRAQAGALSGASVEVGAERISPGDRVLFRRNSPTLGVFNGELGTVMASDAGRLQVRLDQGRSVTVDPRQYPHLQLGYAFTTHRAQGMTAEEVYVLVPAEGVTSRELVYVQASRARGATRFYLATPELTPLLTRWSESRPKLLAHEVAEATRGAGAGMPRGRAGVGARTEGQGRPGPELTLEWGPGG